MTRPFERQLADVPKDPFEISECYFYHQEPTYRGTRFSCIRCTDTCTHILTHILFNPIDRRIKRFAAVQKIPRVISKRIHRFRNQAFPPSRSAPEPLDFTANIYVESFILLGSLANNQTSNIDTPITSGGSTRPTLRSRHPPLNPAIS